MDWVKRRRVEWIGLSGERQDGLGSEDKIRMNRVKKRRIDESCKEKKMRRMNWGKRRRVRWIGLRVKEQDELGGEEKGGMDWIEEEKGRINRERGEGQDGLC